MSVEGLLVALIIGAIAGWLAGQIVRGFGFGLIGNIVIGILGALLASFLLPALGVSLGGGWVGNLRWPQSSIWLASPTGISTGIVSDAHTAIDADVGCELFTLSA